MTYKTTEVFVNTGEIIERESTNVEIAHNEKMLAKRKKMETEVEAKAEAKASAQAKLEALGLTIEDLSALGL